MNTLIIGLSLGFLLFLVSAGLALIFGMLGVVNLAHGAFYMLGAYCTFQIVRSGGTFWMALCIAPVIVGSVGAIVERVTLRPLYLREHQFQFLLTFGLILVINEVVRLIWGVGFKEVEVPMALQGSVAMPGGRVSIYRLFVIAVGAMVAFCLYFGLERSKFGVLVRAASSNSQMLGCLGVNVKLVRTSMFAFATALAAFGGAIAGPLVPLSLDMGFVIIIDCFVVIVLGGLGNIRGVIIGALLIGMTRALGQQYVPQLIELLTFGVLVLTLVLRPQGLFNRRIRLA